MPAATKEDVDRRKKMEAEREAETKAIKARKSGKKRKATKPADLAIVERAKKLAPKTPTWPRQVAKVRKALGDRKVLDVIKMNKTALRAYAKGETVDVDLGAMRELGRSTGDPYCSGRRLGATLVALYEEESK
jgi:hypothetical protein